MVLHVMRLSRNLVSNERSDVATAERVGGKSGRRLRWVMSASSLGLRMARNSCFDDLRYLPTAPRGYPQFRWTKVAKVRRFGVGTRGWGAAAFGSGWVVLSAE